MPYCASLSITVTRVMLRTRPDLQPTADFLQQAPRQAVLPIMLRVENEERALRGEIQRDPWYGRKVPEPASRYFPTPHSVRRVPRRPRSSDANRPAPPAPPGNTPALRAESVRPFQREISQTL